MSGVGWNKVALKLKTTLFRLIAFKRHILIRTHDFLWLMHCALVILKMMESLKINIIHSTLFILNR